ncbi:unnamed protein product [Acanthoscelides obtectus]|uniref:Uncharacterized protein n=1 Tax=Acanthoscelides obtectus TaxID=200917 RepID=A0A9P0L6U4_ACAOB|nr:unnamed protein product [Acanthoscelides obtectus]CAK1642083.1 hypothetical protein AOBTE_LOCUS12826 [Acanthoscelides obtectus]
MKRLAIVESSSMWSLFFIKRSFTKWGFIKCFSAFSSDFKNPTAIKGNMKSKRLQSSVDIFECDRITHVFISYIRYELRKGTSKIVETYEVLTDDDGNDDDDEQDEVDNVEET